MQQSSMSSLSDLQRAVNLAEIYYYSDRSPENAAKLADAKEALSRANSSEIEKVEETPVIEYAIQEDEYGCQWIVRVSDNAAFASQTALAWMCEVTQQTISNTTRQGSECPKALQGLDLSSTMKIDNPNGGTPITAIPADVCCKILYYYATKARGHEDRKMAQELLERIMNAGMSTFIMGMAGYQIMASNGEVIDRLHELEQRLALLESNGVLGATQNQYGEKPMDAYFRRRKEWAEMYRWKKYH